MHLFVDITTGKRKPLFHMGCELHFVQIYKNILFNDVSVAYSASPPYLYWSQISWKEKSYGIPQEYAVHKYVHVENVEEPCVAEDTRNVLDFVYFIFVKNQCIGLLFGAFIFYLCCFSLFSCLFLHLIILYHSFSVALFPCLSFSALLCFSSDLTNYLDQNLTLF